VGTQNSAPTSSRPQSAADFHVNFTPGGLSYMQKLLLHKLKAEAEGGTEPSQVSRAAEPLGSSPHSGLKEDAYEDEESHMIHPFYGQRVATPDGLDPVGSRDDAQENDDRNPLQPMAASALFGVSSRGVPSQEQEQEILSVEILDDSFADQEFEACEPCFVEEV
jgi:hypothetical protein